MHILAIIWPKIPSVFLEKRQNTEKIASQHVQYTATQVSDCWEA